MFVCCRYLFSDANSRVDREIQYYVNAYIRRRLYYLKTIQAMLNF